MKLALLLGSSAGFLTHKLSPFIDSWSNTTFGRLFRYGLGMPLTIGTLVVLRHGLRFDDEAEVLVKDSITAWIFAGAGVMVGYMVDHWQQNK